MLVNRFNIERMNESIPVAQTRLQNLREWIAQHETFAAAASALNMSAPRLSHIAGPNPIRNIGTTVARRVEKLIDKPVGWLDTQHRASRHPGLQRAMDKMNNLADAGELSAEQIAAVESVIHLVTERGQYTTTTAPTTAAPTTKKIQATS